MTSIHRALLCGASVVAICSLTSQAFADPVETVVVSGIRESLRDLLNMKRSSDLVTENISLKTSASFPM